MCCVRGCRGEGWIARPADLDGGAVYRKLVAMAVVVLSGLGVLVASSAASASGKAEHAPKGDAFYVPPKPLAKARPGTIIWSTSIDALAGRERGRFCTTHVGSTAGTLRFLGWWSPPRVGRLVADGWWLRGRTAQPVSATCVHPRSNPTSCPAPRSTTTLPGLSQSSRCFEHCSTRVMWSPPPTTRGSALPACTHFSWARPRGAVCSTRHAPRTV